MNTLCFKRSYFGDYPNNFLAATALISILQTHFSSQLQSEPLPTDFRGYWTGILHHCISEVKALTLIRREAK